MHTYRTTAVAVGLLFIIGSVTAVLGGSLILPIEDGLDAAAAAEGEVAAGVLLEIVLALSVVGIGVLMFPVLRPHGEGLALGYVTTRVLEAVLLIAAAMSARVVLALGVAGATADGELQAGVALAFREWTYIAGSLPMLGVSAVILYSLLWRSRLVPAWLSLWGLLAGLLILGRGAAELAGIEVPGEVQALTAAPIGLNEMVLALWLIVRGFDPRGLGAVAEPGTGRAMAPSGLGMP